MSSLYFMHVFPADPSQPKRAGPSLRAEVMRRAFMLEPRRGGIPIPPLRDLWHCIKQDRQLLHLGYPQEMRDLAGLVRALQAAGIVHPDIRLALDDLSISEFVTALRNERFVSPGFVFDHKEEFKPGSLYEALSDMPSEFSLRTVSYADSRAQILGLCRGNQRDPPG